MKRIISILVLLCFLVVTTNARALSSKKRERIITMESANFEYNFGEVPKDKIIRETIKIKNKLNEVIHIKEAQSSCECLLAEVQSQTVRRNGIFELKITFDPKGYSGKVESIVYIITDNLKYELIRLEIILNISKQ